MSKQEARRLRTMGYFISACRELIENEGIKGVSARKVAEKAGYSYATIYSYFKDMDTLIAYVILEYLNESAQCVKKAMEGIDDPLTALLASVSAYASYYCKYPDRFSMVFTQHDFNLSPENLPEEMAAALFFPEIARIHALYVSKILKPRVASVEKIELLSSVASSFLHGAISFFIYREPLKDTDKLITMIVSGYRHILEVSESSEAIPPPVLKDENKVWLL
ncbi:TetR/AcrR family transcriptional regulator [Myxococcota bacterium]|nr:TetR/AcrR family transcriptional regulator [Myxococcota bacterium]MBU1381184.1 TetR/AcrR family transcriptional regulator [Myxococcota bacterium]MBU1498780.1 TetR/AcrR family transcriptional regulator [Myxococcota bacterium]